jgi:arsenate reductase-like glutaredoxin family protein
LSVIDKPQHGSTAYNKWHGFKGKPSHREFLRIAIDEAMEQKPHDFDAFLALLAEQGFKVKNGKHLTFVHPDFKQNIRMYTLGDEYSEDAIRAIIKGQKIHTPKKRRAVWNTNRPQSIIDIQAKLDAGKGEGYRRWATVENLKRMAKTKLYMDEHGLDYNAMSARKSELTEKEKELSAKVTEAQNRIAEVNVLKTQIVNYAKTRDVYSAYRKSGYSKKFLEEHEADIIIHKAAKKAFDELGVKKLPTVKSLQVEFAELLTAKKEAYAELKKVRDELRDLAVHMANYEELRDLAERDPHKEKEHGRE